MEIEKLPELVQTDKMDEFDLAKAGVMDAVEYDFEPSNPGLL